MYGRDAPGSRGRPAFFATRGTCLVSVNRPSGLFLSHSHGFTNCNVLSSIALRIQRIKVIALNLRTELCLSHPQSESESCTPCLEPCPRRRNFRVPGELVRCQGSTQCYIVLHRSEKTLRQPHGIVDDVVEALC